MEIGRVFEKGDALSYGFVLSFLANTFIHPNFPSSSQEIGTHLMQLKHGCTILF